MNQKIPCKGREALFAKMNVIFCSEIRELSTELQQILIDDMVTAFENRLNVLNRAVIGSDF